MTAETINTAETITSSVEGPLAIVTIDRDRHLNAFTFAMIRAIRAAVDAAAANPAVRAIVITGNGRAFRAGLDMEDLGRSSRGETESSPGPSHELPALFSFLLDVPKPVIAAVNGVAAGGGLVLAMMCDLRFVSADASFTTAFGKRGLIAEHGTAWLLPRLMGTSRALDVLWSARRFGADEAFRLGFADRVLPAERLLDEVREYVADMAASVAPRSIATMKRQVYAGLSQTIAESCDEADAVMKASLDHPDLVEGVASFVERRPPQFAPIGVDDPRPSSNTSVERGDAS
ncbi:MAG: Enoyl-CoA hydratase [Ilumatobacteraceae bacterium]|nr:Enoyl-CoA hydratase [Ilumatobacteraceae bacterium]